MTMLSKINHDDRLYVTKSGPGYSCLGFDVCAQWSEAIASWLGAPAPTADIGTAEAYHYYETLCSWGWVYSAFSKERCPANLNPQLMGLEGKRVEVTTPDGQRDRFWVGKSTGWLPVHLEIKTRRSHGGGAVYLPPGAKVRVVEHHK